MARQYGFTIEETGVKELLNLFDTDIEKAKEALQDATHQAILIVERVARSNVKKVTGGMESKMGVKLEKSKKDTKKSWQVYCKDRGASSLEGGNSSMPAQPFMRPAIDNGKVTIQNTISSVLVERMGGDSG